MRNFKSEGLRLLSLGLLSTLLLFLGSWNRAPHPMEGVHKAPDPVLYGGYAEILTYGPPEVDYFQAIYTGSWGPNNPDIDVTYSITYDRGFRGVVTFQYTITEHVEGFDSYGVAYVGETTDAIAGRYPGQYGHIVSSSVVSTVIH